MKQQILIISLVLTLNLLSITQAQNCENLYNNEIITIPAKRSLSFKCQTNENYRYRLRTSVRLGSSRDYLIMKILGDDSGYSWKYKLRGSSKAKDSIYMPVSSVTVLYSNEMDKDQTVQLTFSYTMGMNQGTFLIIMLNIFPIIIALIGVLSVSSCFLVGVLFWLKRRRVERNNILEEQKIEFKVALSDSADRQYLKQLVVDHYLSDLPVEPCMNILEYLEVKPTVAHPNLYLRKRSLEHLIIKQVYGVFIRNGFRSVYMIFPYVDFSLMNEVLRRVPHCSKLIDSKGLNVNYWNSKGWNSTSWNPKLESIHGINPRHIESREGFIQAAQNITDLDITDIDNLTLQSLTNLRKLKIHSKVFDKLEGIGHLSRLESLSVEAADQDSLEKILLLPALKSIYITSIETCIEAKIWSNPPPLKDFTVYKTPEKGLVYFPLFMHSLRSLRLGKGVHLDPASFDNKSRYCNLRTLSLVENLPAEFFETENIFRFMRLEKLSVSLNDDCISCIGSLEILENLRLLQLRTSGKQDKKLLVKKFEELINRLKYLESALLFDHILFTKVRTSDWEYHWQRTNLSPSIERGQTN